MKKLVTLLLAACSAQFAMAQAIQNNNFESWTEQEISCPADYICSNQEHFEVFGKLTAERVPGFSGSHALKLSTYIVGQDTAFGYIIKGDIDNNTGGVPYTATPDSLSGYVKHDVAPGDTALIVAVFLRSGSPIGAATGKFTGQQSSFQRFAVPVKWIVQGLAPDSLVFAAASSNAIEEIGIADGSTITIDELKFTGLAPNPPNNSFENWTNEFKRTPEHWGSPLEYPGVYTLGVIEKLTGPDAYEGQSSIRIKNYIDGNDTIKGLIGNRPLRASNGQDGGTPFELQNDTLSGYYRFSAPQNDSATVFLKFWNNSNTYHRFLKLPEVSTYTKFELPFSLPTAPDSVQITFYAANFMNNYVLHGAQLDLDKLSFANCNIPLKPEIVAPSRVCENEGHIDVISAGNLSTVKYTYTFPTGFGVTPTAPDSSTVRVSVSSATAVSGYITSGAKSACGVSPIDSFYIHVDSEPGAANLTLLSDSALDAGVNAPSFIWTFNGDTLPDTTRTYKNAPQLLEGTYEVTSVNGACFGTPSSYSYIVGGLGAPNAAKTDMEMYPNPANSKVTLVLPNGALPASVVLYNTNGQEVLRVANQTVLDVSKLQNGLYTVVATDHRDVYVHTLVVE